MMEQGSHGLYLLAERRLGFDLLHVQTCLMNMPNAMHTITVQVKHLCRCLAGQAPEGSSVSRKNAGEVNEQVSGIVANSQCWW